MRTIGFAWLFGATVLVGCQHPALAPASATIVLQPLGHCSRQTVRAIEAVVTNRMRASVQVRAGEPMPKNAYYSPRQRWRAPTLAADLTPERQGHLMVIGITDDDISNYGGNQYDWGIFGYGRGDLGVCLVSMHRIGKNSTRLKDVVTHEMGHALGLPHCPTSGCIMQPFNGKARSPRTHFCAKCWSAVEPYMRWN